MRQRYYTIDTQYLIYLNVATTYSPTDFICLKFYCKYLFLFLKQLTQISETYTNLHTSSVLGNQALASWQQQQQPACNWHCSRLESSRFFEFLMNFPPKQIATQFFLSIFSQDLLVQVNIYVIALYIANAYLL